jgi:hypothetical protein
MPEKSGKGNKNHCHPIECEITIAMHKISNDFACFGPLEKACVFADEPIQISFLTHLVPVLTHIFAHKRFGTCKNASHHGPLMLGPLKN